MTDAGASGGQKGNQLVSRVGKRCCRVAVLLMPPSPLSWTGPGHVVSRSRVAHHGHVVGRHWRIVERESYDGGE